jgi:hypothetical protein
MSVLGLLGNKTERTGGLIIATPWLRRSPRAAYTNVIGFLLDRSAYESAPRLVDVMRCPRAQFASTEYCRGTLRSGCEKQEFFSRRLGKPPVTPPPITGFFSLRLAITRFPETTCGAFVGCGETSGTPESTLPSAAW